MIGQIQRLFLSLSRTQRILVVVAALAAAGGLWWMNTWNHERGFQPLFSGLNPEDAGAVVTKLKESGVEYRISENGTTVLAPKARIAELRIQLASAGIPKTGRIGYELFDKNNFGITDFAEQVNYRRALEGELERSVLAVAGVESARVHITPAKDSLFTEGREPAKASVLLTLKNNAKLPPANVDAIAHLVSSAVQGLEPERVSVVDNAGRLLPGTARKDPSEESEQAEKSLQYRQRVEKDLLEKINTTLEPLIGNRHFRATVSVECDFSSGEQNEELFDPEKAVVANSQKSEESSASASAGGQPGTASNLPRPPVRAGSQSSPMSRKTENTTYQNSRVVRKLKLPQGTVKRMSISVLLDHNLKWEVENGRPKRVVTPPAPEQLKSIRELVTGITGVDQKRGDTVVVESLAFDATLAAEPPPGLVPAPAAKPTAAGGAQTPAKPGPFGIPMDQFVLYASVGGGILLVLLLGGGYWWLRRRKNRGKAKVELHGHGALHDGGHGHHDGKHQLTAGGGKHGGYHGEPEEIDEPEDDEVVALRKAAIEARQAKEVLNSIQLPENASKKAKVLSKHIAEETKRSPETVAQIVRAWLNSEES